MVLNRDDYSSILRFHVVISGEQQSSLPEKKSITRNDQNWINRVDGEILFPEQDQLERFDHRRGWVGMKSRGPLHSVERMLSRRCYRSRYLLACEPSDRSRLMARSIMNVAARATAITASWYHKSRLPCALGHLRVYIVYARVHTRRPYALLSIRGPRIWNLHERVFFFVFLWCRPVKGSLSRIR